MVQNADSDAEMLPSIGSRAGLMPHVLRTRQAETDLLEIWIFIAEDSIRAADRLLDRFEEAFRTLSTQPRMGRSRPELSPNLRSFPIGDYLIF